MIGFASCFGRTAGETARWYCIDQARVNHYHIGKILKTNPCCGGDVLSEPRHFGMIHDAPLLNGARVGSFA
jgi:hypothetical protein